MGAEYLTTLTESINNKLQFPRINNKKEIINYSESLENLIKKIVWKNFKLVN